jgi:RNA polymerase sigma-70 factor (ECF subfamily)
MQEYNRLPQAVPLDDTNTRHDPPAPEPSAETALINDERSAKVRRIVGGPERDAQIVRALFLEDRDKDQVCAEFGIDRGYLRVLLHRALKRFREEF